MTMNKFFKIRLHLAGDFFILAQKKNGYLNSIRSLLLSVLGYKNYHIVGNGLLGNSVFAVYGLDLG